MSINEIDNKRTIWQRLLAAGTTDCMPTTYLTLQEFRSEEKKFENAPNGSRMLFLKTKHGVAQNGEQRRSLDLGLRFLAWIAGVWVCDGARECEKQLTQLAAEKKKQLNESFFNNYVIQYNITTL